MAKNTIATCFIKNKAYRVGEYALLVRKSENKNYNVFKTQKIKILSLYYIKDENGDNLEFYALVENERGICLEARVEELQKIESNPGNSSKYSLDKGVFNFKAYETLNGEIKYFISDTFNKPLIY